MLIMNSIERMLLSLRGLSVGDAFGEKFHALPESIKHMLIFRDLPPPPWPYTDDTEMALSVVEMLRKWGRIDQDELAEGFARRFDPHRGYGAGAYRLLADIHAGADWRAEAPAMFGGSGSFGNGAAMRIAPLGAYFADDLDAVVENAVLSAQVTHAHPEGAAGAIAVAVAAAIAWCVGQGEDITPQTFLERVADHVPPSKTRGGIIAATNQSFDLCMTEVEEGRKLDIAPGEVARVLGSGQRVSVQDTVPFALWCAARHLDNYEEALWATASGLGDVDTTCAIVGGIVSLSAREKGIPDRWLQSREALPEGFELANLPNDG